MKLNVSPELRLLGYALTSVAAVYLVGWWSISLSPQGIRDELTTMFYVSVMGIALALGQLRSAMLPRLERGHHRFLAYGLAMSAPAPLLAWHYVTALKSLAAHGISDASHVANALAVSLAGVAGLTSAFLLSLGVAFIGAPLYQATLGRKRLEQQRKAPVRTLYDADWEASITLQSRKSPAAEQAGPR